MRTSNLWVVGAVPGAVAVGYFLLTGYLLNRVRLLPIAAMPQRQAGQTNHDAGPVATPRRSMTAARS
jgi:hypothetical protein